MRLFARRHAPPGAPSPCCGGCRHFDDDPRRLEAALPGLNVLSSASASVMSDDGLCARHDCFTSARGHCPAFVGAERDGEGPDTLNVAASAPPVA